MLCFDFDGTLFMPENEVTLEPIFFDEIRRLREDGWLWTVNTGRSLLYMLEGFEEVGFPFSPDYLVLREREIYTPGDRFGRWHRVDEWHEKSVRDAAVFFADAEDFILKVKEYVEEQTMAQWVEEEGDPAGIIATSEEEMAVIAAFVEEHRSMSDLIGVLRNTIYMRFVHRDYHKGTSLTEVARLEGLCPSQIFAIGDGHNDLDMLRSEVAGMLGCVGNAHMDVKAHVRRQGGYEAAAAGSLGSVEALRHFLAKGTCRTGPMTEIA